jgi:pyridinium-3,5-bisthiocarboxylic acid mononucleotide nickel chelatase
MKSRHFTGLKNSCNFTTLTNLWRVMKILYYDCFSGISGDMNLGALLDLGVDFGYLQSELLKLPVHGYTLEKEQDIRKGISGTRLHVILDEDHKHPHDHGHHHHSHEKGGKLHGMDLKIGHSEHEHEEGHHHHNSYREIKEVIKNSSLNEHVKELSLAIFEKVALAEAKIHNKPVDDIGFHEVGAVDSIVDIVGAAICLDKLAPDAIYCSTIELGSGMVRCAHGIYPVPAPATAEILKNIPVKKGNVSFEATTPTGAAILAATVTKFVDKADFTILSTGHGIGSKDGELPNVLRVFLGEKATIVHADTSYMIECNIDDMNPEFYDYVIDMLLKAGAKDVYLTPIIMKKSRPAVKLSVLCTEDAEDAVHAILFRETSTIGTRKYRVEKTMLDRQIENVETALGTVRIKTAWFQGKRIRSKPEYDDCIRIAKEHKMPLQQVYREIEQFLNNDKE